MTYEFVKQLDDAGFPATPRTGGWVTYGLLPAIAKPNLSELIKSCGGDYHDFMLKWRSGYWWAIASIGEMPDIDWQKADTPEEAVAKLWLELNKI